MRQQDRAEVRQRAWRRAWRRWCRGGGVGAVSCRQALTDTPTATATSDSPGTVARRAHQRRQVDDAHQRVAHPEHPPTPTARRLRAPPQRRRRRLGRQLLLGLTHRSVDHRHRPRVQPAGARHLHVDEAPQALDPRHRRPRLSRRIDPHPPTARRARRHHDDTRHGPRAHRRPRHPHHVAPTLVHHRHSFHHRTQL
jgi:hypothetical protein